MCNRWSFLATHYGTVSQRRIYEQVLRNEQNNHKSQWDIQKLAKSMKKRGKQYKYLRCGAWNFKNRQQYEANWNLSIFGIFYLLPQNGKNILAKKKVIWKELKISRWVTQLPRMFVRSLIWTKKMNSNIMRKSTRWVKIRHKKIGSLSND